MYSYFAELKMASIHLTDQIGNHLLPFLISEWPGVRICPSYLLKDFPNEEVSAEGEAVAVEFFQHVLRVLHHFFAQEDVKTFIPAREGDETAVKGALLSVGDPHWSQAPRPLSSNWHCVELLGGYSSHRSSLGVTVLFL